MIIQSVDREFEVIRKSYEDKNCCTYIAKDMADNESNLSYEITCVENRDILKNIVPIFLDMKQATSFEDFETCFSQDGKFFIVFRYFEGTQLVNALEDEHYTIQEKLILVKNLYQHIILLDMPMPILYEVLQEENLYITDSLDIQFNYHLSHINQFNELTLPLVHKRLVQLLRQIFKKEIKNKSVQEITEFIEDIEYGLYEYIVYEYKYYVEIFDLLYGRAELGELKPQTLIYKIIAFFVKIWPKLRNVLVLLVIVGALLYLLFYHNPNDTGGIKFNYIGTLELNK
ncbi:MAG: hypothetical protein RR275_04880 [Lachnospiraceae bacterium]